MPDYEEMLDAMKELKRLNREALLSSPSRPGSHKVKCTIPGAQYEALERLSTARHTTVSNLACMALARFIIDRPPMCGYGRKDLRPIHITMNNKLHRSFCQHMDKETRQIGVVVSQALAEYLLCDLEPLHS